MKIFLTAPPGTGKSTIIDTVVTRFKGTTRGIVAKEILDEAGRRVGFNAYDSACNSRQFMFLAPSGQGAVGAFNVDVKAIDEFVVPELRHALHEGGLVYVDEIGRAQARSQAFISVVHQLLRSDKNVLASIVYDDEPWSMEFKRNKSICFLEVTEANRDALPDILLAAFEHSDLFSVLTNDQKTTACGLLSKLIAKGHFVAARKLFDNALLYVTGNKVRPLKTSAEGTTFEIQGKTRDHILKAKADGTFECDCDLSNARGEFNRAEPCSHQLSVLIKQNDMVSRQLS